MAEEDLPDAVPLIRLAVDHPDLVQVIQLDPGIRNLEKEF